MQKPPENLSSFYESLNQLIEKKQQGRFKMRSFVVQNYPEMQTKFDDLIECMKWLLIRRGRGYHYEIQGYAIEVISKFKQLTARELSQVCGVGGQSINSAIDTGLRAGFSNEILQFLPHLSNSENVYKQCYNCLFGNGEIDFVN